MEIQLEMPLLQGIVHGLADFQVTMGLVLFRKKSPNESIAHPLGAFIVVIPVVCLLFVLLGITSSSALVNVAT